MNLKTKLYSVIHSGLERQTLNLCSRWTEKCRVMGTPYPGPWTFDHHPWLRAMHDADNDFCVGQKAAQMGYTEVLLNRTFFKMDIRQISALYILPAKTPDATDFSASRFDSALELSPYLQRFFSDVKNVGHKRAGNVNLYIRGSRSRSGLKSVPAGSLFFDEVDEMTQDNIPLAFERQSGQLEKQTWMVSTPTIDTTGINSYFINSNQQEFFFKCPHCGRWTQFIFPDCLEITSDDPTDRKLKNSYYMCKECKHVLSQHKDYLQTGKWIAAYPDKEICGFHINQMYSSTIEPWRLAESYLMSLVNAAYEQEFFNSKLGLPHIVAGARINDEDINNVIGDYKNGSQPKAGTLVTMGIDVGRWLHYVITEYSLPTITTPDINMNARARVLEIGKVLNFEDIDTIIYRCRPTATIIDMQPERRKSYELTQRFWGYIWGCWYGNAINGKQINKTRDPNGQELEQSITVDRTSWLDLTLGRFSSKTITLPIDTPTEFKSHIKALVKKPEIDKQGNPTARYLNLSDDHYSHALNYAEIALVFAASIGQNKDIRSPR